MFGEKFNEGGISLAVVRFSTEVDGEFVLAGLDDFFL